ncbi:MAG: dihydrofolate reductase family protein [Paenibacillaceae bacterium]|nr:dihydrofolate reductase family protein [Paenibacillaceae bacterium]
MRKIIVSEFLTLDGIMEDPGGAEGSAHGGWSFPFANEQYLAYKVEEIFSCDALLLGRVTYQGFAGAWPSRTDEHGFADRMNSLPKYVATTTLEHLAWNNSTSIKGNIAEEAFRLKQQPGKDILVAGSCQLVHMLLQHDLIDELRLMIHPIVIGNGKRLFKEGIPRQELRLIESQKFDTGVVVLTYEPGRRGSYSDL